MLGSIVGIAMKRRVFITLNQQCGVVMVVSDSEPCISNGDSMHRDAPIHDRCIANVGTTD
jgi:hypothetical protein